MQPQKEVPLKQISCYLMYDVILDQTHSGTVYKAKHKDTSEPCLIKVITKERLKQDVYFAERIKQEEKLFSEINNPSILRFLTLIETSNYYYFISEGSEEGNLETFLNKSTAGFSEEDILGIVVMILQAYYEFFKRNMPYNNISSKSLFKFGNEYKLSPFFLPVYYENMENSFKNYKPSPYLCPEALEDAPNTSKRDIWALGILIYVLYFGKVPFSGDNIIALSKNIEKNLYETHKNIDKNPRISADMRLLMKRMLEIETKRITWQDLLESPLFKSLKKSLETTLIKDYDKVCDDLKAGKVSFTPNRGMPAIKALPAINTNKIGWDPDSPILKRDTRNILECLNNEYSAKAKLLSILEQVMVVWGSLLLGSPKKITSPKKKKSSPTKKKCFSEKPLEECDNFEIEIDEGVNVRLPQDNSQDKKTIQGVISSATSKKNPNNSKYSKEEQKSNYDTKNSKQVLKKSNSASSEEGNHNNNKDTMKIMKPGVYPQIAPHDKETEKVRMNYLKSLRLKKEALKPILEMSVEESSTLDTLTISVIKRNFEDVVKEFFYRYLHENEILEFLFNSYEQMEKVPTLHDKTFQGYCLMKLIMMRFVQLQANIDSKNNVFSLDFWKEIVNLEMYKDIKKTCILDNQKKYNENLNKAYFACKNSNAALTNEQKKFLNGDLNIPHSEFNKNFNEAFHLIIKNLPDEAKNVEKKNKKNSMDIYSLVYRLMFCLEISKVLSFIKLDLNIEFDIVEFQERLQGFKQENLIQEVEMYKNKLG